MSAGYLGKISAIVTVNTSDIASKVQSGFAAPFEKALRSIETTLRNTNKSVEKSFADMYTSSQKRLRAQAAAQMGAVKNFDNEDFSKRVTLGNDVAARIGKLAQEIEKTSGTIRSRFEPALVSAQAEAQELIDRLQQKLPIAADEIGRMAKRVDDLSQSFVAAGNAAEKMEKILQDNEGLRSNLRQEQRLRDNQGASSPFAPVVREALVRANIGASSPVSFQSPFRPGRVGPVGPVTTGLGASTSIEGMGQRTILPPNYLQRLSDEQNARRQAVLDESAARARDNARRLMQEERTRQREEAVRFSAQAVTARRESSSNFAGSLGGRGTAGINLGLDKNALAAATAELQIIQRAIGKASAEARGPAVDAFARLKNAISDAFENGTIESEATRKNIARLRQEAINTTAQVTGVSKRGLASDVKRAGDVSRGGLDKFSLALQQAGFAIDDFFSSTGGLDMRIRAVSNNISQMAFILGGTAGLFTGLAFTIGSQLVVAMMKYNDAGKTSEDRTKALNTALEKQKSLANELADAYSALADSLKAAMSPQGAKAEQRAKLIGDVASKRKQSMEESIYANDTGVANARAAVAMEEKKSLVAVTTTQQQTALLRVELAKRRVEEAKAESLKRNADFNAFVDSGVAGGAGASVQASIQQAIQTFGRIRASGLSGEERARAEQDAQRQMAAVPLAASRAAAADQLRKYIDAEFQNNPSAREPGGVASPIVAGLLEQLARLEFGLKAANSAIIDDVTKSLLGTSDVIENAKKTLESAAMETQGTSAIQTEIDRVAATLAALSTAASETTDRAVLDAIAEDAAAAKALGDRLNEAARGAKEFADKLQAAIAEENAAAARGVELGKIRDQGAQADDIRAAAANIGNNAERRAFVERAFGNVVADTQTALKGFAMERENAILAGPSRAALNASDLSTGEGQRELNRLLRGDDASRDVNFAEMKHQSDLLQTIADRILAATGIAVDFR